MSTLAEIRTLVFDRMAQASEDPMQNAGRLNRVINSANLRLGRVTDWPWLIDIGTVVWTPSATTYDLSTISNYRATKVLSHSGVLMKVKTASDFVKFYGLTTTGGNLRDSGPVYYNITGNTLRIAAVPTTATTLDHIYVVDEAPLITDLQSPRLPNAYTELLVLAACKPLATALKDTEKLNIVRAEFKEAIQEAINEVRRSRQLPSIRVDDSMWRLI